MSTRMSRTDIGNLVFDCLSTSDPTIQEATETTGLTAAQWHSGLAYVRDVLAEVHSEPVVYDPRTRRYSLAMFETEVDAYIAKRLLSFMIQLRRLYNGSFVPAGMKFQTERTREFARIDILVHRLLEDLDGLRTELGIPLSASLKRNAADRISAGLNHQ
jgi:hypothetical protein